MDSLKHFEAICNAVRAEALGAQVKYGDFYSMHEGYGVLAEEVAELFECIRIRQHVHSADTCGIFDEPCTEGETRGKMITREAIQVAAVALRIAEQAGRILR